VGSGDARREDCGGQKKRGLNHVAILQQEWLPVTGHFSDK
jgi:hypothetical protein